MEERYTFIMDYLGGTYVSQVYAKDEHQAARSCIQGLDISQIKEFTKRDKEKQIAQGFIGVYAPVLLKGLVNAWCIDVRTRKGFAIVTFVKTAI